MLKLFTPSYTTCWARRCAGAYNTGWRLKVKHSRLMYSFAQQFSSGFLLERHLSDRY